jgi:hypothetical protein
MLIESKIILLSSWDMQFSSYLKDSPETKTSDEIIDFIEQLIVIGILERGSLKEEDIPGIVSVIEMNSKSKNNPNMQQWKCILNLFQISSISLQVCEEISNVYIDQWFNTNIIENGRATTKY